MNLEEMKKKIRVCETNLAIYDNELKGHLKKLKDRFGTQDPKRRSKELEAEYKELAEKEKSLQRKITRKLDKYDGIL